MPQATTFNGTTYQIPLAGELNWSALSNFLIDVGTNAAIKSTSKQSVRVATTTPVTVSSSSDYAIVTKLSVAGAVAVNLPAGATGQFFVICDGTGDALTNNVTVTANGAELINGSSTVVIDHNRGAVILAWNGTGWNIIDKTLPTGTIVNADISASAALARSKVASGTANHVVINDGSGNLSSEAQLAGTRGGTGVSSTATFPASGVVVTEAATETLTNKTISGGSNTITNVSLTTGVTGVLPTANGGTNQNSTATFPTSGVVVTEAATETLTNKTISGASNTITNVSLTTGVTGVLPTANGGTAQNSTATFPTSGVVVTEAATETLTNKTLTAPVMSTFVDLTEIATPATPGAGVLRLYSKSGDALFYKNSGGTETQVSTTSTATPTVAGVVTSYYPTIQSSVTTSSGATINITTTDGVQVVYATATTGTQTVNLPAAASNTGRRLLIKKTAAGGKVVVDPNGSELISGATTTEINAISSYLDIDCDGSAWFVTGCWDYLDAQTARGSDVTLTSTTAKTVVNIALPAGVWMLTGMGGFRYSGGAQTVTSYNVAINDTDNTLSSDAGRSQINAEFTAATTGFVEVPFTLHGVRFRPTTTTTTYYLVANAQFGGVGTVGKAYGTIVGTRMPG